MSADDARAIARVFHDLAVTLGNNRFDNWNALSPSERHELESRQWTLLTNSSDMTTHAMHLAVDDMQAALNDIRNSTAQLQAAVQHASDVRAVITLAAAAVTLGAALLSGDASAIASAVKSSARTAQGALKPASDRTP